ncbi:MAG: aminotransferase class V-fold PLP-dependent enzyme [Chloroflexi bacterium]|uniref:Aminotransferase class V-fold PLP-dependent enzyme n=1 Tax=Candidatus Chlorohelix allophototropha TaxID=3003348 RepID=A0A8T7M9C6_9CHLR|nr:aminotransferase class V-fold PLP-dependent enzyme [Chloroflexota bacterium]WJW68715.1 aminotransferase class V-fold PLP-dependent enzyme [Chloroflexota bacterium L227-S17]
MISSPDPNSVFSEDIIEQTLDPENWEDLKSLGHQMLDDMFDFLQNVRERPVWQPVPAEVKQKLKAPLPLAAEAAGDVYEEFKELILPYPTGNIHPRFWGWVMGTGSPYAMLADMLASGMNSHVAGYDQSAAYVEEQVIRWLAELLGFPATSSGVLASGGTVANLLGLAVARNVKAGFDVRAEGLQQPAVTRAELVVYCSTETHSWAQKAVELMGLGDKSLKRISVDALYKINLAELEETIRRDKAQGKNPICVIGNAGTVNTGAIDDLEGLARICRQEGLWFHVDGAIGALVKLTPSQAGLVSGLELADSLAFDLHKWLYMPYEAGCILVRDRTAHQSAFSITPSYLTALNRGIAAQPLEFAARGVDLSRSFKALKIWFSLKVHGIDLFGQLIEQNIRQAAYLKQLIEQEHLLELLAPVELSIVCFRFNPSSQESLDAQLLDRLNQEILLRLQESGKAVPSGTRIQGRFAIRVAITNHRSRKEDFELLCQLVVNYGQELLADSKFLEEGNG